MLGPSVSRNLRLPGSAGFQPVGASVERHCSGRFHPLRGAAGSRGGAMARTCRRNEPLPGGKPALPGSRRSRPDLLRSRVRKRRPRRAPRGLRALAEDLAESPDAGLEPVLERAAVRAVDRRDHTGGRGPGRQVLAAGLGTDVGGGSLLKIVAVASVSSRLAPEGSLSRGRNVSPLSSTVSSMIGTATVFSVSPGANVFGWRVDRHRLVHVGDVDRHGRVGRLAPVARPHRQVLRGRAGLVVLARALVVELARVGVDLEEARGLRLHRRLQTREPA